MDAPGRSVAPRPAGCVPHSATIEERFSDITCACPTNTLTLLTHLLKWQLQPAMRSLGWSGTIREQRRRIEKLLRESPSLRPFVAETLSEAYAEAREDALEETGLPEGDFPVECPFSPDEVLSRSFLPER